MIMNPPTQATVYSSFPTKTPVRQEPPNFHSVSNRIRSPSSIQPDYPFGTDLLEDYVDPLSLVSNEGIQQPSHSNVLNMGSDFFSRNSGVGSTPHSLSTLLNTEQDTIVSSKERKKTKSGFSGVAVTRPSIKKPGGGVGSQHPPLNNDGLTRVASSDFNASIFHSNPIFKFNGDPSTERLSPFNEDNPNFSLENDVDIEENKVPILSNYVEPYLDPRISLNEHQNGFNEEIEVKKQTNKHCS
jgi:hypothetical protein